MLVPDSRDTTWDVIRGGYGPDIASIDLGLAQAFATFAVDPRRVAVGDFSDGPSYALSRGLGIGGLFGHAPGVSVGLRRPSRGAGQPLHLPVARPRGEVLPVKGCGRRLARALGPAGYDLDCREFAGGHDVAPIW